MNGKTSVQLSAFLVLILAGATPCFASPTIWTGPMISFNQAAGADPSLAANQDRITSDIWITRGTEQGLYNAFDESSFSHFSSPQGTKWANGSLANYASLSYTDWNDWAKGVNAGPPSTVGVSAVVHIIPDDIYLAIQFTSWGGLGGGFSYMRSTAALVPEPATTALLMTGLLLVAVKARKRPQNSIHDSGNRSRK